MATKAAWFAAEDDVALAAAQAALGALEAAATVADEAKADLKAAEKCKRLVDLLTCDRPAVRTAAQMSLEVV